MHWWIVLHNILQNKGYANNEFKIMGRAKLNICKCCNSSNIKKDSYRMTNMTNFKTSNA